MTPALTSRDPRVLAIQLLLDWNPDRGDFIDRLVNRCLKSFEGDSRDRGFLTELTYGITRHRNTLSRLSKSFLDRPEKLTDRILEHALFLGFYQAVYLKTPSHALVNSTIEAYQQVSRQQRKTEQWISSAKGLLNAVLRKACREITFEEDSPEQRRDLGTVRVGEGWARAPQLKLPTANDNLPALLGIKYSHSPEIMRLWLARFGEEETCRICDHNNRQPVTQLVLRHDVDLSHQARKLRLLSVEATERPADHVIEVRQAGAIDRLPGFEDGNFWVQDRTARRLVQLMPKRPDATLLDLCAAPGGKLMALLNGRTFKQVTACDVSREKLHLISTNLERIGWARRVELEEISDEPDRVKLRQNYQQILVDAPCSNSGVFNRRVDARWRLLPESLRELQQLQLKLLSAAARHLETRGDLVYSTCSIEPSENEEVVQRFLSRHASFRLVEEMVVLPGDREADANGETIPESIPSDGGYGARLTRSV